MTGSKRLTPPQSRKVNSLVKKECCNCERGHCILLDDGEECVCLVGVPYVFQQMVDNAMEQKRYSGLRDRIEEIMETL